MKIKVRMYAAPWGGPVFADYYPEPEADGDHLRFSVNRGDELVEISIPLELLDPEKVGNYLQD